VLAPLVLAACQSGAVKSSAAPLGRNVIACRNAETIAVLHAGGPRFQRIADNEMASGNCRVFQAAHAVRDRQLERGLLGFVDPGTGYRYWAYPPG